MKAGRELPWIAQAVAQALGVQRGHAVLVHGPQGVGQFEFCLALAQAWLCESPARGAGDVSRPACGACASCHLFAVRAHPDALVLLPPALRASLGWEGDDADAGDGEGKSGKAKPSQEIKVDAVRAAVAFAQQTSARGRAKVVVAHPAERMNLIAANTLLKTLEEPPGVARFVLSTGALDALLPTIRSRCQLVRLPLPETAAARDWLAGQGLERPDVMLAAAGGQPLSALDMQALGLTAATWEQLPRQVAGAAATPLSGWPLPTVVDALGKLCHDVTVVGLGQPPRYFPATAVPRVSDVPRLTAWAAALRRARRSADHPLNAGLQVESLLLHARQALSGAVFPPFA